MHRISFRQAGFIRALIATLLLVFASQTFAVTHPDCQPVPSEHSDHSSMSRTAGNEPAAVAMTVVSDCCASAGCEMVSCAPMLLPAMSLRATDRLDQPYLIYSETLQSVSTATLLRPPIRH